MTKSQKREKRAHRGRSEDFSCFVLFMHCEDDSTYNLEVSGDSEHSQDSEEELHRPHVAASAVVPQCSTGEAADHI